MNLQSKATRLPAYICNSCCLIVSDNHLHFVANKMADLYRAQFTLSSSLFLLQTIFSFFAVVSLAADRITREQSLKDGEILTSSGKSFELGFFSPSNTSLRHVGIWYSNISLHQSIVWVANRNHPLPNKNGSLTIGNDGNLLILDGNGSTIWSSQASNITENSSAILFDDGNFVLKNSDQSYSGFCWRSFDHPTNTYLPGMKLSVNAKAGVTKNFISWKNESNPSEGRYSMGVDPQAAPQIVIWNGTNRLWRTGHWNGLAFLGVPSMDVFYYYGFKLSEPDPNGTMYLTYTPYNRSSIFQFRLTWDGKEEALSWESESSEWNLLQHEPFTVCDVYNKCGNYGVCSVTNSPICDCMKGFEPNEPDQWNNGSWSGGCTRKTRLQCDGNGSLVSDDGFLKVEDLKLPDFADLVLVDEDQCDDQCLKNCSCKAYAYVSGIGCMTWIQDLLDLQQFEGGGSTLYVRLASAELGGNSKLSHPIVAAIVVGGVLLLGILLWLFWKSRAKVKVSGRKRENNEIRITNIRRSGEYSTSTSGTDDIVGGDFANAPDLPLLGYNYVAASTNYFSKENKLGQGGFGPVYKGKLPEGQEIAVKVLSRRSGQGIEEFKNEIELIAKLQHRNLVKLLGCCIQGEEKMLIYEFMPNKSLDCFIFDAEKTEQLDWRKRFIIIEGIARGLLYLHRDSRVKIVHRDLKSSNILLDKDMNPKISDFGMARIFGGNQDHANTNRVVGTYGYMSPEYAMEGLFSEKSDVFSFGVLLLEIITGRRNSRFHSADHRCLVEYAWELWTKGKAVDLIDPAIKSSCLEGQVCRCVQIALLSVQDQAVDRPTISSVVLWLESDAVVLPIPKEPTYTSSRRSGNINSHIESTDTTTGNDVTITTIVGR